MPSVLTPLQVRAAYGFNQISFIASGRTIQGNGSGQTIAIVDAFNDPSIASDLDTFDKTFSINGSQTLYQQYGAASKVLTVAKPEGQPGTDPSGLWEIEEALDVEWAHAIAPGATILLVEAASNSFANLMNAVNYARNQPGVVVVSMSWGDQEFAGETSYDGYFTTPAGHVGGSNGLGGARLAGGVTFVASSGDSGAPGEWPATSPNVVAVGGTTLNVSSSGAYLSETAWSGSGGGPSSQEREPSYQTSVQHTGMRTAPDVAYDANPSTGVYVYSSYPVSGYSGWFDVGGTSAAAPQWAALIAIADQGRALAGKGALDGATQTLPALYSLPSWDFHQIVSGSNGHPAGAGYNLVTGRGTPFANRIVSGLVATTIRTAAPAASETALPLLTTATLAEVQLLATAVGGPTPPEAPAMALPDSRLSSAGLVAAGAGGVPLSSRLALGSVANFLPAFPSVVLTGSPATLLGSGGMDETPAEENEDLAGAPASPAEPPAHLLHVVPAGGADHEAQRRRAVDQFFLEVDPAGLQASLPQKGVLPSEPPDRTALIGLAFALLAPRLERERRRPGN